eukprot:SAG31_NODE_325_length_17671_cov_9.902743_20_plen_106_part_00
MFQCVMMNLWASGKIPHYNEFWSVPAWCAGAAAAAGAALPCVRRKPTDSGARCSVRRSLFHLLFVTYFREFHFYWCHRMIHPVRVVTFSFLCPLLEKYGTFYREM